MDWFEVEKHMLCMNKMLMFTISHQKLPERQHQELPSGPVGRFLQYKQVPEAMKYELQSDK